MEGSQKAAGAHMLMNLCLACHHAQTRKCLLLSETLKTLDPTLNPKPQTCHLSHGRFRNGAWVRCIIYTAPCFRRRGTATSSRGGGCLGFIGSQKGGYRGCIGCIGFGV